MYEKEADVIIGKLDAIASYIQNERSDMAEPIVFELQKFVNERRGL